MTKTIVQEVVFKNTTTKELYELYIDARKHTEVTGAPAQITDREGIGFSAHNGHISGENVKLIKDSLIVQSWRGADWGKDEPDSTLTIHLEAKDDNVTLRATHSNIPEKHVDSIEKGWHSHYWEPWKAYLAKKQP
jgi:activator of HSP90 ATPase